MKAILKRDGEETASFLIKGWATTSGDNNPQSIMMQLAARKEFGLDGTSIWWKKEALTKATTAFEKHEVVTRRFLREMYNDTQAHLAKQGLKSVRMARGFKGSVGITDSTVANPMGHARIKLQPMSSFSSDLDIARGFTTPAVGEAGQASLMFVEVPANRILSCPVTGYGCRHEYEWVVLGAQRAGGESVLATTFDFDKVRNGIWDLFDIKMDSNAMPNLKKKIAGEIFKRIK